MIINCHIHAIIKSDTQNIFMLIISKIIVADTTNCLIQFQSNIVYKYYVSNTAYNSHAQRFNTTNF